MFATCTRIAILHVKCAGHVFDGLQCELQSRVGIPNRRLCNRGLGPAQGSYLKPCNDSGCAGTWFRLISGHVSLTECVCTPEADAGLQISMSRTLAARSFSHSNEVPRWSFFMTQTRSIYTCACTRKDCTKTSVRRWQTLPDVRKSVYRIPYAVLSKQNMWCSCLVHTYSK